MIAVGSWIAAKGMLSIHGHEGVMEDLSKILPEDENTAASETEDMHNGAPEAQPVTPQAHFDTDKITLPSKGQAA